MWCLDKHYLNKDFWKWFIFFEGGLNKAYVQHLETRLYKLAKDANKVNLDNENEPTFPKLSPAEKAEADGFLLEMLNIFPLVGLDAFQKEEQKQNSIQLYLEAGGVNAEGYETQEGFVVKLGSAAVLHGSAGIPKSLRMLRRKLNRDGIMKTKDDRFEFVEDYPFRTPARAAGVILGRHASKSEWKDDNGTTLGEIQEKRYVFSS